MKTGVTTTASRGVGRQAAVVMTAMALAIAAAWSGAAWSQPGPMRAPERMEMRHGHHGGGGDLGGAGMFRGSPQHMERRLDRMLDGLQATDAQRTEIKRIARQAVTDLRAMREQGRGSGDAAMAALAAPTLDAQAVERARQQRLAQHDAASKRMTQAMLEAARVLTPEQRAKIGQRLADRKARMEDSRRRMEQEGPRDGRRSGPGGPGGPRGMAPPPPAQPGMAPAPVTPPTPPQPRS